MAYNYLFIEAQKDGGVVNPHFIIKLRKEIIMELKEIEAELGWDYRASGKVQRWICKECGKMTIQNEVQTTE